MSYDTRIRYGADWYGNVDGVRVFRVDTDTAPARDIQAIEIPGRSGDLILDNKKYHNVDMVYTFVFYNGRNSLAEGNVTDTKRRLLSSPGYKRLVDNTYPDEFYMAVIKEDFEPVFSPDRNMVKMTVTFNRKPQRFLTSGNTRIHGTKDTAATQSETIANPYSTIAQPLFQIYGTGTFKVNDQIITISSADEYTMIDSEMMDCYKDSVSKNANVTFSNHEFPVLTGGTNTLEFGPGITEWYVTPRLWRL